MVFSFVKYNFFSFNIPFLSIILIPYLFPKCALNSFNISISISSSFILFCIFSFLSCSSQPDMPFALNSLTHLWTVCESKSYFSHISLVGIFLKSLRFTILYLNSGVKVRLFHFDICLPFFLFYQ